MVHVSFLFWLFLECKTCFKEVVAIERGGRRTVMSLTRVEKTCFSLIVKWRMQKHTRAIAPASFSS